MFHDAAGRLRSMLLSWTSVAAEDAFVVLSAGRSLFRFDDLLALASLLRGLEKHDEV